MHRFDGKWIAAIFAASVLIGAAVDALAQTPAGKPIRIGVGLALTGQLAPNGKAAAAAMRIWIDPLKLIAKNVTANDIEAALQRENVELPSGKISGNTTELTVRTFGRLNTEEDFNNMIISEKNGAIDLLRHW